jgi:hypothetical protein
MWGSLQKQYRKDLSVTYVTLRTGVKTHCIERYEHMELRISSVNRSKFVRLGKKPVNVK